MTGEKKNTVFLSDYKWEEVEGSKILLRGVAALSVIVGDCS